MTLDNNQSTGKMNVGIDIGSTTTKVVVVDSEKDIILYSDYRRHYAKQLQSVKKILKSLQSRFGGKQMRKSFSFVKIRRQVLWMYRICV